MFERHTFYILERNSQGVLTEISNAVYHACAEQNWWNNTETDTPLIGVSYQEIESHIAQHGLQNVVFVGSVESTNRFLVSYGQRPVSALNIPPELDDEQFLHRKIWRNISKDDVRVLAQSHPNLLIKPGKTPKLFPLTRFDKFSADDIPENEPLFVQEELHSPIVSEWRVFVKFGKIVDIRQYWIDKWTMPDQYVVQAMVQRLRKYPAITLDVGVLATGPTAAIECHHFLACGTYGFEGVPMLNLMRVAWMFHFRQSSKLPTTFRAGSP